VTRFDEGRLPQVTVTDITNNRYQNVVGYPVWWCTFRAPGTATRPLRGLGSRHPPRRSAP